MKQETILDVLMYLFDHHIDGLDESTLNEEEEQAALQQALYQAGFQEEKVSKAFDWLETLAAQQRPESVTAGKRIPMRLFMPEEKAKLEPECRGFLLFLEQNGVLGLVGRELIIDRCMALDDDEVSLEQLKWVTLMVLFNQPGQDADLTWMENVIYDELMDILH